MARNGSGDYTPPNSSWSPAINGTLATAGDFTALLNDISAALTQSVSRDGQSPMTGNLNMGNNKINGVSAGTGTGQALAFEQLFSQGVMQDVASSATTDIGNQNSNFLKITGNTTITSFGSNFKGPRFLVFEGAVTLTNSSTLVLPGGANITTAAGDCCIAIPKATLGTADGWQVVGYQKNAVPGVIPDGSITTAKIAANAVTPAKMANNGAEFGMRNRLINAQGLINQRGYVSGTATSGANQYTVDRWRVVTSGQNLTFSTTNNVVTFTAPAGGVEQVIEGLNLESGTYVLSWTGTATATVAGNAVTNGGIVTVVGGTNTTVKFSSGTFSLPQFEKGSTATSFDYRPYGTELALCQRYTYVMKASSNYGKFAIANANSGDSQAVIYVPVQLRTTPTVTTSNISTTIAGGGQTGISSITSVSMQGNAVDVIAASATYTANVNVFWQDAGSGTATMTLNSEL